MRKILLLSFILVMFLLLIACEQYVSNKSDDSLSDDSGLIPVAQIEETETEETETEEAISIVGTWHYEKSAHDCYIAFYSDGTGLIHYYQNYGSQTNLTGYGVPEFRNYHIAECGGSRCCEAAHYLEECCAVGSEFSGHDKRYGSECGCHDP